MHDYEDDIVEVGDLGDDLRVAAMEAWQIPESAMTRVPTALDLPVAAALQGPAKARRMFAAAVDPYRQAEDQGTPLLIARSAEVGLDLVRLHADTRLGRIHMLDTATFTMFSAPDDAALQGELLNLGLPVQFQAAEADGWASTAPELWVQNMADWTDRIDMRDQGDTRLYLLYKIFPGTRSFAPTLNWF